MNELTPEQLNRLLYMQTMQNQNGQQIEEPSSDIDKPPMFRNILDKGIGAARFTGGIATNALRMLPGLTLRQEIRRI